MHKTSSIFRILQSHVLTNSWFIRSSKARMKRCSRAPNAREATVRQSVENAPASNNHELVVFARASKTKRKDARERRRRERKNLEHSMWVLRKSGLVHHCFGKKCTKQVFSERFRVTCSRARGFGARLPNKQEKMFASAEGASGEKLRHSMRGLSVQN